MKAIYVSGPYSAPSNCQRQRNIHRAWNAAVRLWSVEGVYAVCPHLNTMHMDGTAYPEEPEKDYEKFIAADLDLLDRCDAIWMMEGFAASRGAVRDLAEAERLGKRVFYAGRDTLELVRLWAKQADEWECLRASQGGAN